MLELILCSMLTLLPDYLFRRYAQGKRFGREITLYSVWYELRWGITTCLILTVLLITIVLYNHPASKNVTSLFRTISIFPESVGRVAEVYVGYSQDVHKGDPLFRMDSSKQEAALETARRQVAQVDASMVQARADIQTSQGKVKEAQGAFDQAMDELRTKQELQRRNPDVVAAREVERLQKLADGRQGTLAAAFAAQQSAEARVSSLLPAERASAEAALAQAQVDLDKTTVYAGMDGRVEQFLLRTGDIVTAINKPAGIMIPKGAGQARLQAGFNQIEAQVVQAGMIGEATCVTMPMTIIPLVVTRVQPVIAAGQIVATEQLADMNKVTKPGTVLAFLEPLYAGGLDGVPPGSSCIANLYSNHHDEIVSENTSTLQRTYLHIVDAVALVHALVLRLQTVILPLKTLVFGEH